MVTDDAALCEHVKGSFVYTDEQSVASLDKLFDALEGECYRVSSPRTTPATGRRASVGYRAVLPQHAGPDSAWLKAVLLHWPKIARMVPSDKDRRLPVGTAEFFRAWPEDVARFSAQYDYLLDLSVAEVEKEVGEEFLVALEKDWRAVEDRYALR